MRRFPLVFGAMQGKRVSAVLRALAPLEPQLVFTRVAEAGALPPEKLSRRWQRIAGTPGRTASSPETAIQAAAGLRAAPDQPIVVAGSLYLVGAVRGMLVGEEVPA